MRTHVSTRRAIALAALVTLFLAPEPARSQTVFRYTFSDDQPFPTIEDSGPAANDALAGAEALLSEDIPFEGVPDDAGDLSLDSGTNLGIGPSGAVTNQTLLLTNDLIAAAGGFTMECWFKWNGAGSVNSAIDYAGTEKIVVRGGTGAVEMLISGTGATPVGTAIAGDWHYVAVVFDSEGNAVDVDGNIAGSLSVYFDSLVPTSTVPATKDTFGDSLARPIGVAQHPVGFAADFFDGLVYEPRVTLGALAPEDLLFEGFIPDGETPLFLYAFASDTPLPTVPDASGAGNPGTAGSGASLSTDIPGAFPEGSGDRSLDSSGGTVGSPSGVVTNATSPIANDVIENYAGFTFEGWFQWQGGGDINAIIDYAGTERVYIDSASEVPGQVLLQISGAQPIVIGRAVPGRWHWFAVVFSTGGATVDESGSISGTLTTYFDQLVAPTSTTAGVVKDDFGDGFEVGIGVGQTPEGGDFFDGLIFAPKVSLGAVAVADLTFVAPPVVPGTVFRYSFSGDTELPFILDQGPLGNDAIAGDLAMLSPEIPLEETFPEDSGELSLDIGLGLVGATTTATLLLSNDKIASAGGFTMEAWFYWNGFGQVNSIIDYAGTEKIVLAQGGAEPSELVEMLISGTGRIPIGRAAAGEWHYVAVVFDTLGAEQNADGTITGRVTTYLDSLAPSNVVENATKDNFGDSLVRGIGVGEHPVQFSGDFFDGLVFEPRVSLGALAPEDLLLQVRVTNPAEPVFLYSFSESTELPTVLDQSAAMNDATASDGASLSTDLPGAVPLDGGDRSLDTSSGGLTTDATGLLDSETVSAFGGFTMEAWFIWNGGAASVIDYGGSEKIVVTASGEVQLVVSDADALVIGQATGGTWHYVAAVFDTQGAFVDGGTVTGEVTTYFDGLAEPMVFPEVEKDSTGDGRGLGIGVGQSPVDGGSAVLNGAVYEPRVWLGPLASTDLRYVRPVLPPAPVFRYSEFDDGIFPLVVDFSDAENNAIAGDGALSTTDIPTDNLPEEPGELGLDAGGDSSIAPTGVVTENTLLLSNDLVEQHGGFTMECWILWLGGGQVNSIIDYAGTDKIVIDERAEATGTVSWRMSGNPDVPIGTAIVGEWHYVAIVFNTYGAPPNVDGALPGDVTLYFDDNEPVSVVDSAIKDTFGDSLVRSIGVAQHPNGFAADFFNGFVYEPRVTLGPLPGSGLLFDGGDIGPVETNFVRGDADGSGVVNLTDGINILLWSFQGGAEPACLDAADTDDSGSVNLTDPVVIFQWLFLGGTDPAEPTPTTGEYPASDCGPDPTDDDAFGCRVPGPTCDA